MQNNNNVIAVTGNEKDYLIKTTLANRIEANKKIDEGLTRFFHNARIIQSDLKDILDMIKESGVICRGDMKINYMDMRAFDYSVFYKLDSYRLYIDIDIDILGGQPKFAIHHERLPKNIHITITYDEYENSSIVLKADDVCIINPRKPSTSDITQFDGNNEFSKSLKFTPKLVDSMEKVIEQVHDTCHERFAKIILPD